MASKTEKTKKEIKKPKTEEHEYIKNAEVISNKEKQEKQKKRKASFLERLCAFIIDMILISMVTSLIAMPFSSSKNYEKLTKESHEVIEQYQKGKIDAKTYINRTNDITYDISRETGLLSIIEIFLFALYFIVIQYKSLGKTVGKSLLKIRVEKIDQTELTMNDLMFRALIVDLIVYNIGTLCFAMFGNKDVFHVGTMVLEIIQWSLLFISAIMILSRKDKRGIHDLITKTQVVKIEE